MFVFGGQTCGQLCDPVRNMLLSDGFFIDFLFFFDENHNIQAVPALNGTSFDFVPTENGPVSLDLYSTPQYKRDPHGDCTGELFASPQLVKLNDPNIL